MTGSPIVAVVGCGSIGIRHLRNLRGLGLDPVGVDSDPGRRRAVAELGLAAHPAVSHVSRLDAAIIATPAPDHLERALEVLERDCDVLIEKPVTTRRADVALLRQAAASRERLVAVGYNLRFDAAVRVAREAIASERVGRPLHARVEYAYYLPSWRPGRDYRDTVTARADLGGGILLEASHELDLIRWIFGEWRAVTGVVRRLSSLEIDVEDTVAAIIELSAGPLVELHLDCVRRGYRRGIVCVGETGVVEWDVRTGVTLLDADGVPTLIAPPTDPNDAYIEELRDFLDAIARRRGPAVGLSDGEAALELVEAIRSASASGATVRR